MMRSEADIRREVENRLRRRGLLLVNGGLWAMAAFGYWLFRGSLSFGRFDGFVIFCLFAWACLVGLHMLRVAYVEVREWLVRGAIERERQFYLLRDNYEKRKRSEEQTREETTVVKLSDDGELVDAPDERKVKAGYE